jgi:hypothetical protein
VIHRAILAAVVIAAAAVTSPAQLEWDKPSRRKPFPNPSAVRVSRDDAVKVVKQVLEEQGLPVKSESLEESRGVILVTSEPVVFTKGIVADTQFRHFAEFAGSSVRKIVRGRVTLKVEVAPTNPAASSVAISAHFEGLAEGATQSQWVAGQSRGLYEDRLLCIVVSRANDDPRDCDDDEP